MSDEITQAVGAPLERHVRPHQRRDCTQRYTWLVRYMRRFGDRSSPPGCPHYALQFLDYREPSGGGGIAMERALFEDPLRIFSWRRSWDSGFLRREPAHNYEAGSMRAVKTWVCRVWPNVS